MGGQTSAAGVTKALVMPSETGIPTVVHDQNTHSGYPGCVDAGANGSLSNVSVQNWSQVFNP